MASVTISLGVGAGGIDDFTLWGAQFPHWLRRDAAHAGKMKLNLILALADS